MTEADKEALRRLSLIKYVLNKAKIVTAGCLYLGIPSSTFYRWKKAYHNYGIEGLKPKSWGLLPWQCNFLISKKKKAKSEDLAFKYK